MLGNWIDRIQKKIDTAVDFLVEEEEEEEEEEEVANTDEVDDQAVGEHGSAHDTSGPAPPQSGASNFASSPFQMFSLAVEPGRNRTGATDAALIYDVGEPLAYGKGLDEIQAREAASFQINGADLKDSRFLSTLAVCDTTQAGVYKNPDSKSESLIRADLTESPSVSQHLEKDRANLASQEEMDENVAVGKANPYNTPSVNELLSEKKSLTLDVGAGMVSVSSEGDLVPSSSLSHFQEKPLELVRGGNAFQEGGDLTYASKMQPAPFHQSSADAAHLTTPTEGNNGLKGHLRYAQSEHVMGASASVSTNAAMPVVEECMRSKGSNSLNEDCKGLLAKISELEAIVIDYQEKEDTWRKVQKKQQEALISLQHQKSKLEEEQKHRKACVVELSKKLSKAQELDSSFAAKLQDMETKHANGVNELDRHHLEVQNRLENQIKDLREVLHRSRVELDEQASEAERRVCEANQRAHFAEMQLAEAELRSSNFLYDLKTELEDTQKRFTLLSSELDGARNECAEIFERYDKLKREQAIEENDHHEYQLRQAASLYEANKEIQLLKEQVGIFHEKLLASQREVEDLKRQCMMLEAMNLQKVAPENSDVHGGAVVDPRHDAFPKIVNRAADETSLQVSPFKLALTQQQNDSVSRSRVFYPPSLLAANVLFSSVNRDDTTVKSRDRLEKEIIRQAAEIDRLKGMEVEIAELRRKLAELNPQYDLLLQMYGQLEEEYNTQKALLSKYAAGERLSDGVDHP